MICINIIKVIVALSLLAPALMTSSCGPSRDEGSSRLQSDKPAHGGDQVVVGSDNKKAKLIDLPTPSSDAKPVIEMRYLADDGYRAKIGLDHETLSINTDGDVFYAKIFKDKKRSYSTKIMTLERRSLQKLIDDIKMVNLDTWFDNEDSKESVNISSSEIYSFLHGDVKLIAKRSPKRDEWAGKADKIHSALLHMLFFAPEK